MNRMQRITIPLWAFVLTLSVLLAAGGAARVEYVSHKALHGNAVSWDIRALHDTTDRAAATAEALLPPRISAAVRLFHRAVETIATWIR